MFYSAILEIVKSALNLKRHLCLVMGQEISKPLIGETPRDWMYRNNKGFNTEPYLSNLAGWSEGKVQLDPFPRDGSFKDEDMRDAKSMVKEGWGDPAWDYDYMKQSYDVWEKMKSYWDKGPEQVKNINKDFLLQMSLADSPSAPPPRYENVTKPADSGKTTLNRLYPQLPNATDVFPFVQLPDGYKITPLSMSEAMATSKELPDPTRCPHQYVSMLRRLTAYSQLTGRDYRFILTKTLPPEITEEELIAEIGFLSPDYDAPPARRGASSRAEKPLDLSRPTAARTLKIIDSDDEDEMWVWADAEQLKEFFKQLTAFLVKLSSTKQDLSHAANTKQKGNENPVAFFNRFKHAWTEESAIPLDQHSQLFVNTFLNNMHKETAQLVRLTTPNINDISVEALSRRLRELSIAGAFDAHRGKAPAMMQFNVDVKSRPKQVAGSKVCFYCGKIGHFAKVCRQKELDKRQKRGGFAGFKPQPKAPQPKQQQKERPKYPTTWTPR